MNSIRLARHLRYGLGHMTDPLTVVCWKWKSALEYRSQFNATHVNVLQRMVARHLHVPHRFVCITDDAEGIECETLPLWEDPQVYGIPKTKPNCFRRLRLFAKDAADLVGPRYLSIDLDAIVCDDITPLVDRPEDLVIWGDTARGTPYNGSMVLLRTGTRTKVWDEFDPVESPALGKRLGYIGSDQAWIGACLGKDEAKWGKKDGVFSFRNEIEFPRGNGSLPKGARIVFFHGQHDPWDSKIQRRYPWIAEHWK
jgi:hypothetical protein